MTKFDSFDEGNVVIFIAAVGEMQKCTILAYRQLLLQKLLSKHEFLLRVFFSLYLRGKDHKQQLSDAKIIFCSALFVM